MHPGIVLHQRLSRQNPCVSYLSHGLAKRSVLYSVRGELTPPATSLVGHPMMVMAQPSGWALFWLNLS
jgi:hypothetical protein